MHYTARIRAKNPLNRVFVCSALFVAAWCAQAEGIEPFVRLRFVNPGKERLVHWPLFASLPLPPGAVREGQRLGFVTEDGKPIASAATPLALWPDGSWKWVELRGYANVPASGSITLGVAGLSMSSKGNQSPDVPRVSLRNHGGEVEIDTGPLRFRVREHSRNWFERVVFQGKEIPGAVFSGNARVDGKETPAGAVEKLTVLDASPLRAFVQLEGRYSGSPLRYRVRLESFAGQPFVRIEHTFIVETERPAVQLEGLSVRLKLPDQEERQLRFTTEGSEELARVVAPATVRQWDAEYLSVGSERRPGRLRGWFDIQGTPLGVTLWGRWFWQQYPQSVTVDRQGVEYALYDGGDGPTLAGAGAAKSHEFGLFFYSGSAAPSAEAIENLPLTAAWPTGWLAGRSAMPVTKLAESTEGREFLRSLEAAWQRVQRTNAREEWDERPSPVCPQSTGNDPLERRRRGFYGMWNWGDWNYPGYHDTTKGCDAWGNLEYDLAHVLALAYMATGERRYLEPMVAAARHFMDVDVIHFHARYPQWVGMNHPKNPLHWSFDLGGVDLGHTWVEGLLWYYLLVGDPRGLDAARGIGNFLLRRVEAPLRGNPRQFGWPQIALVALYELTGDVRYLQGAKRYAELGMERHPPEPVQEWKLGIFAEGLSYTHRHSRDARIQAWLQTYSRAVRALPEPSDARLWPAVAYMARFEGDAAGATAAKKVVRRLDFSSWAKPFTIAGRVGFAILTNLLGMPEPTLPTQPMAATAASPPR